MTPSDKARKLAERMALEIVERHSVEAALPYATAILAAKEALARIAEGNLGPAPWQADYAKVKDVARDALYTIKGRI